MNIIFTNATASKQITTRRRIQSKDESHKLVSVDMRYVLYEVLASSDRRTLS